MNFSSPLTHLPCARTSRATRRTAVQSPPNGEVCSVRELCQHAQVTSGELPRVGLQVVLTFDQRAGANGALSCRLWFSPAAQNRVANRLSLVGRHQQTSISIAHK